MTFYSTLQLQNNFLHMLAFHLTKNREDAVDLYQETLYRAIKNEQKFIPGSNLKAWLGTIMKNQFINTYRAKKRRIVVKEPIGSEYSYVEYFGSAERNLGEIKLTVEEINKEVEKLNPDFSTPMKMMIEGHKYEEIAEKMQVPLGTIKSRLHQARKVLQLRFTQNYGKDVINK